MKPPTFHFPFLPFNFDSFHRWFYFGFYLLSTHLLCENIKTYKRVLISFSIYNLRGKAVFAKVYTMRLARVRTIFFQKTKIECPIPYTWSIWKSQKRPTLLHENLLWTWQKFSFEIRRIFGFTKLKSSLRVFVIERYIAKEAKIRNFSMRETRLWLVQN